MFVFGVIVAVAVAPPSLTTTPLEAANVGAPNVTPSCD
jgi:hypothetical protein